MEKYVIAGIVAALLVLGGLYFSAVQEKSPIEKEIVATLTTPSMLTYATSTFSIQYPEGYGVDSSYVNTSVNPKKPISGVSFKIPESNAAGTNLSSDTYLAVETLPRAKNCTGDIYLFQNVRAQRVTENGTEYSLATSSGAVAGNSYEEFVYALSESKPCVAVRYFIHSGNIGNYPPAQSGEPADVREFDRAALLSEFDSIRKSLVLIGE